MPKPNVLLICVDQWSGGLLGAAGHPCVSIPESVEGLSPAKDQSRPYLYGEHYVDELATRMIRTDRYKLIYYPTGNRLQPDVPYEPSPNRGLTNQRGRRFMG